VQTTGERGSSRILSVTSTARPKRIAILIDTSKLPLTELDLLTQECARYWGGGFWPIIPTDGRSISEDWWSVLEAVDADVICSACVLEDSLCQRIHRRLAPASLTNLDVHRAGRPDASIVWRLHDIAALDAYQIVQYHARMCAYPPPTRFLYLTDSLQSSLDRTFVLRNFGLVRPTITSDTAFKLVEHDRIAVHETTKLGLLYRFIGFTGQVVVPRDLSRLYAPRPFDLEYYPPAQAFQLIVGDTADEAVFAWNRPLASDGHAGRDFLWLDSASARDSGTVNGIAEWIKRVFWSGQQQRGARILSYSEDLELLRSVGETIRSIAWLPYEVERLNSGQFPFRPRPAVRRLVYQTLLEDGPRRTERVPVSEQEALLGVPRPPFVQSTSRTDGWMLDLDVEYRLDPARYTNQSDSWRLPRRAQLGQLFSSARRQARIVLGGLPSVSVAAAETSILLLEPSKVALLSSLLGGDPDCVLGTRDAHQARRFKDVAISEQGRSFRGLIDLIGSVHQAGRLFEDVFWRTVFLEAAGKPSDDIEQRAGIVMGVLTRAREIGPSTPPAGNTTNIAEINDASHLSGIARKIVQALHRIPSPLQTWTHKNLRDRFGQLKRGELIHTDSGQRRLRFDDYAEHELRSLLGLGVLLQGVVLDCPTCGTKQWRGVDDIRAVLRCEGCTAEFPLPPKPEWMFRQNALVQSAVARDGILPLLHAIYKLTKHAREMALVVAPQELRESFDGRPITDLDLVLVTDGVFIIGEVKSDPAAFSDDVVGRLADVTETIRPDRLVLAAAGSAWPDDVGRRIDELQSQFAARDVQVTSMLLDW